MNDIVEMVLNTYSQTRSIEDCRSAYSTKVGAYLRKLASAGKNDVHELTAYGLVYLKELHEGPDTRYTGC